MSDGLDIIVVDDDPGTADRISRTIKKFYTWGTVFVFTGVEEALSFSLNKNSGIAIFIVDVFLNGASGFYFLDAVGEKFPTAHEDSIMITGNPSDDVVNMCVASNINYLLEKPVKPHTLQLAVRSITRKYIEFAKKLLKDPNLAQSMANL
jgi:DNA-binding NarL/FixJ family response regulator